MEHPIATVSTLAPSADRSGAVRGQSPPAPLRRDSVTASQADVRLWNALLGPPAVGPAELQALAAVARSRAAAAGETVFSQADRAKAVIAVREGDVALGLRSADGGFHTERIVRGPAWLDVASAWLGAAHAMDAQAISAAFLIELPREALNSMMERHGPLARRVIQALAREVQTLAANTHELMHKDAPARLAHWLRQRCQPADGGSTDQGIVRLRERKRDVASQLAITPETLSRLMRNFMSQGVIDVAGYTVRVLNVAALERLAAG
jgi:CRP-like cAMP-binding protein